MNWSRVKTILIIALLGVNLMLAVFILERQDKAESPTIDRALILELLDKRLIDVGDDLFDIKQNMTNISLDIQRYDLQKAEETFKSFSAFESKVNVRLETNIEQNKALTFKTYGGMLNPVVVSDDDLKDQAYALIKALGYDLEDTYIKSIGATHEKSILTLGQKINGHVLRDSEMIIKYNNDNLLEFYRLWYDVSESYDGENTFYQPEYVLYQFMGDLYERFPKRQRPIAIETFDMVYQLSPDQVPDIENSALQGEASISYRIVTSDQVVYLIQAIDD